jgi:hypothetical protein
MHVLKMRKPKKFDFFSFSLFLSDLSAATICQPPPQRKRRRRRRRKNEKSKEQR